MLTEPSFEVKETAQKQKTADYESAAEGLFTYPGIQDEWLHCRLPNALR